MEVVHLIKNLQENNLMIKVDLKGLCFGIPLYKDARKNVRFLWEGNLYEFLCQCFGLGPASRTFTKVLTIPRALLKWKKFSELIPVRKNINFFIAKSGFCNKFEEIPIDTSKEDRDSWSDNQLKVNDFSFVQEMYYRFSKQACNQ